jgi:uncharacterized OsmC-like protein
MYSVEIQNHGDMKFHATTRDFSFVMGVNGGGANPVDTVLVGLCGCVGHYVRDFLTNRKIACANFIIRGEAKTTKDQARLSEIDIQLDLQGVKVEKQEEEALLKHVCQCKVHNTLSAVCDIKMVLA